MWSGVEFHFSLRTTRDWKSESVTGQLTNLPTYQLTWVGARDTCVSNEDKTLKLVLGDFDI